MRYTKPYSNQAQAPATTLAPRAMEDHLNLSAEQLDLSYSEQYQALNYVNEQIELKGSFQFYPSDYYDPIIHIEEPILEKLPSQNFINSSLFMGIAAAFALFVLWQFVGIPTQSKPTPRIQQAKLKQTANFGELFKQASAKLVAEQESNETKPARSALRPIAHTETFDPLSFDGLRQTALANFDLDKTGRTLALVDLTEHRASSKPRRVTNTKNITDTTPNTIVSVTKAADKSPTFASTTRTEASVTGSVTRESVALATQFSHLKKRAKQEQKLYFLKFGAPWCLPCQLMEETSFQDEQLLSIIEASYLYLNVNVDLFDGVSLKQQYQVESLPTIIIFDQYGRQLEKMEGSISTTNLINTLQHHREHNSLAKL